MATFTAGQISKSYTTCWDTIRHQLPGVVNCAIHNAPLYHSRLPYDGLRWSELMPPVSEVCHATPAARCQPLFRRELSDRVTRRSLAALEFGETCTEHVPSSLYATALRQIGFQAKGGRVASTAFGVAFRAWLHENITDPTVLAVDEWWLRLPTRLNRASTPLQHVLLRCFIEDRARQSPQGQGDLFSAELLSSLSLYQ